MIRISLRNPAAASGITEKVSLCVLIGLALISVAAAVDHIRTAARPKAAAMAARPIPQPAVRPVSRPTPVQVGQAAPAPASAPVVEDPTPEPQRMARNVAPPSDKTSGEADRGAPPDTATVIARQKDLPLLRDDQAFETWGGEFAKGDSRLKEMIQAGALTSIQKGAKVRILEVRGPLAHVEVVGQGRTGWIRTSFVGR